jgi:hypothetical protein
MECLVIKKNNKLLNFSTGGKIIMTRLEESKGISNAINSLIGIAITNNINLKEYIINGALDLYELEVYLKKSGIISEE